MKVDVNDNVNKTAVGIASKKVNTTKNVVDAKRIEK